MRFNVVKYLGVCILWFVLKPFLAIELSLWQYMWLFVSFWFMSHEFSN